ncbi:MAG: four helix bundle protein [Bacteroidota bacterium]
MDFLSLNSIEVYTVSFKLSNRIWDIATQWPSFARFSIGDQIVRSSDSISANIAEGFGRYHKKDKIRFYRYSMGSIYETIDWLEKANIRNLITDEEYIELSQTLNILPKKLNGFIKYTNQKLKT